MTAHYGDEREWVNIGTCPGCGMDHPEAEFKRGADGVYRGRCWRGKVDMEYDPTSDAVVAVGDVQGTM